MLILAKLYVLFSTLLSKYNISPTINDTKGMNLVRFNSV